MASIRLKRLFGCLFICICSIFLMSHNVFAAIPADLRLVQIIQNPYWRSNNGESFHNGTYSFGNNTGTYNGMNYIYLHNNSNGAVDVPAYSFIRLTGVVVMYAQMDGVNAYEYTASPNGYFNLNTGVDTSCKGIDLEYVRQDSYAQGSGYVYRYNFNALFYCYDAANTPTLNLQVNNQNSLGSALTRLGINNYSIWQQNDPQPDFSEVISAIDKQAEDEKNAVNDAVNDANNSAESNTDQIQDATGDTQASIQGVIDVILNTSATNCEINANLGKLNLGNLNMCSAPSSILNIISAVSGIIGVIVTVNVGRKVIFDVQEIIMRVTNG